MSQKLGPEDLVNESLDEEMERKGTSPIPDWLNVKKQVRLRSSVFNQESSLTGTWHAPLAFTAHVLCVLPLEPGQYSHSHGLHPHDPLVSTALSSSVSRPN
jgi:hypothetical protein